MGEPIISVVMSMYNSEKYIGKTIESILRQTFTNFELLLLNDGSTDRTLDVIKQFNDPRIKIVDLPHDFIETLNKGLSIAIGKYIVRMDSDDYMYPFRIQQQFDFMENNPEIDVCGGIAQCFGDRTDLIGFQATHADIALTLLYQTALVNGTTIIRRQSMIDNDIKYNKEFIYAEDYKLWTDFVMAGCKLSSTPNVVIDYNCHSAQVVHQHSAQVCRNALKTRLYFIEYVINLIIGEDEEMHVFMKKLCALAKKNNSDITQNPFIGIIEFLYSKHLTYEQANSYHPFLK